ncbi:hypothetical protein AB5N19_14027 [Seiridium cardinale]|uniref:F-box domain-containing protein n=1 Tax=Seiridium cardinale TaxID=138064 RepID=A0ABR2XDL9_9PEZI
MARTENDTPFMRLPLEIIHMIIGYLEDPVEVFDLARCCRRHWSCITLFDIIRKDIEFQNRVYQWEVKRYCELGDDCGWTHSPDDLCWDVRGAVHPFPLRLPILLFMIKKTPRTRETFSGGPWEAPRGSFRDFTTFKHVVDFCIDIKAFGYLHGDWSLAWKSPLQVAVKKSRLNVVRHLVESGYDLNTTRSLATGPIDWLAEVTDSISTTHPSRASRAEEVGLYLMDQGIHAEAYHLKLAAKCDSVVIMQRLLEEPWRGQFDLFPALKFAVTHNGKYHNHNGPVRMVELLLSAGATPIRSLWVNALQMGQVSIAVSLFTVWREKCDSNEEDTPPPGDLTEYLEYLHDGTIKFFEFLLGKYPESLELCNNGDELARSEHILLLLSARVTRMDGLSRKAERFILDSAAGRHTWGAIACGDIIKAVTEDQPESAAFLIKLCFGNEDGPNPWGAWSHSEVYAIVLFELFLLGIKEESWKCVWKLLSFDIDLSMASTADILKIAPQLLRYMVYVWDTNPAEEDFGTVINELEAELAVFERQRAAEISNSTSDPLLGIRPEYSGDLQELSQIHGQEGTIDESQTKKVVFLALLYKLFGKNIQWNICRLWYRLEPRYIGSPYREDSSENGEASSREARSDWSEVADYGADTTDWESDTDDESV